MASPTGTTLHLQRLSTEDGPGIRTTVFLKGCLLRCQWCHNPESLLTTPQIQRVETHCIQCSTCIQACPLDCLQLGGDFVQIDRARCDACGICVAVCPTGALELLGTTVRADDLVRELLKDRSYFQVSEGGVTLSGGEPALQADFCAAVLAQLRRDGIHTALDTCGMTSERNLLKLLPHANLVLYDLKEIDPARHQAFTGQSNEVILRNLLAIREAIRSQGLATRLWVRTPLIPGATATRENLAGIGAFLRREMDGMVERWELCAFNNLCRDKYARLGMDWSYAATPLLSQEELEELEGWARASGFDPERVIATGATRVEKKLTTKTTMGQEG